MATIPEGTGAKKNARAVGRASVVLAVLAASVLTMLVASPAYARSPKLFVGPGPQGFDTSCSSPGFTSIQGAVNAARTGTTIVVCAGTYAEQVVIGTPNLTIVTQGSATLQPTTATVNAADTDTSQPIVALILVKPGAKNVKISGLTVDGSLIESSAVFGTCNNVGLAGVLYQAGAGGDVSGVLKGLKVENFNPTNAGCGNGLGIFAQAGTSGSAHDNLVIQNSKVSGYGKNGITCSDVGTVCRILRNTITTSPTSLVAQNGVQMGFGAVGQILSNKVSGNDWTAYQTDTNPQRQSDYGAGILLYGAGISNAGATSGNTTVNKNALQDNQIGVEVVDSDAALTSNHITETSPGLPDSIGVYGVGCDAYCGYFNANNNQSLTNTAAMGQTVSLTNNRIDFVGDPAGSYGIWMGDDSWTGGGGYYGPAGSEAVHLVNNSTKNVDNKVVIGGGATTS